VAELAERSLRPLAAATAVACPLFLLGLHVDSVAVRLPAKPWIHLLLVAWLLARGAGDYARRLAVAIATCMVADVVLEFRGSAFLAGMGVFLAGQLTLASAFVLRCREARPMAAPPALAWLAAAYAVLAPGLGAMQAPVLAYMAGIGLMMWRATAWAASSPGDTAARLALAGAIVFGASDTTIALDRFHAPVDGARYFIIVTYWAALGLIAASGVRGSGSRAG
jgi:alkenylglycerophosphocholine hydrolase